ncbi:12833_t:CDS:2 [Acaulospora colombiana]|nr:12833_t:CDS:2 [Acaulospora colombiana]
MTTGSLDSTISDAMSIPQQTWDRWKELLASTIANQPPGDSSATTALGDYLLANNWAEAAHSWQEPPSSQALALPMTFHTQLRAIELSEIAEYAISLLPMAKGQEAYHGLPHLQAYRLWHAISLAEFGELGLAKR